MPKVTPANPVLQESELAPALRETRKYAILDVAARLFAAQGFEGVSFRDLTAATGAKRPLLLYHFSTKEGLWQAAMRSIMARFDRAIEAGHTPVGDGDSARIVAAIGAYIDALVAVPEYGQVLLREGVREGPRLSWLVRHFVPAFVFDLAIEDEAIANRLKGTMLRDLVIGAPLVATALGPLIEASTAAASSVPRAGIHPLSRDRRDELVALMAALVIGGPV